MNLVVYSTEKRCNYSVITLAIVGQVLGQGLLAYSPLYQNRLILDSADNS